MRHSVAGFRRVTMAVIFSVMALAQAGTVWAGDCGCAACTGAVAGPACGVAYQLVERTIQVPTMVTERRTVNVLECRTETRERQITVQRVVPETSQVRDVYTVMVPKLENRVERYQVSIPVWREVERDVTLQVPTEEVRQGVRHVCRQVQVQEMQQITRDLGHWDEVLVDVAVDNGMGCSNAPCCGRHRRWRGCGGCNSCCGSDPCGSVGYDAGCAPAVVQQIQRVWRPDIVTEEVPVVVWRNQVVEEPYEYAVTVYRPVVQRQKFKVCEMVLQEEERNVQVTVCVPEQRESIRNVTTYKTVAEPQIQRYTVQVPHSVQKEVDVQVCRLIPRTVQYRVPVPMMAPSACGACGGYGCGNCWH